MVKEAIEKMMQEENNTFLQISCESIEQEVEQRKAEGSFTLESTSGKPVKGKILVEDPRVEVKTSGFGSELVTISYTFDGSFMEPGEEVSGVFVALTNFGEYEIPYTFACSKVILDSSLGEIKNIFHFTNLARSNWQEALKLYFSPGFETILMGKHRRYREIYRALSVRKQEQYMDEFLQAVHKKSPITYEIATDRIQLNNVADIHREILEIQKKGWGYTRLDVTVKGDFLTSERAFLGEDDFLGNVCKLPLYIDASKLHMGKNWGEVILSSPYGTYRVLVLVCQNQHHRMAASVEKRRNAKWLNSRLTMVYLHFRSKKMAAVRFKKESEEILEALQKSDERNPLNKLYGAHLYITQEKYHEAKWLLDRAGKSIKEDESPVIYAYYLYLTTLITEDKEYVLGVKNVIEELYYNNDNTWQIAWLYMYLSKELHGHAQKKWEFLKQIFQKGCTSPVMYMEAMLLLNYQPTLLMELGEVELRILRFGQKKGMLSDQLKGIVQYLALKEKDYSYPVYQLLTAMSKEGENPELLQAICSLLIKGNKIGQEYFPWYEKAILAEIKITRLYEYYMMSLDREKKIDIPRMVLMYFSYQMDMNQEYATYLYRHVYENRELLEDLYLAYAPSMERYLLKKLYAGQINEDLGYLYEQIIFTKMMTHDNAKALSKVIFTHKVDKKGKAGEKIVVVHSQLKEEEVYPLGQKKIAVQVYNQDHIVLWQDSNGYRFLIEDESILTPCVDTGKIAEGIAAWVQDSSGLALYMCEGSMEEQNISDKKEPHLRYLSNLEMIRGEDKMAIRAGLLDFYFDEDWMEKLDACLEEFLPTSVAVEDRKKLIHYMVVRGYYEKAYEFIQIYGPKAIEAKDLVRVSFYMLEEQKGEENILLWFIHSAFQRGKYNAPMLEYMVAHYEGTSKVMRDVFKACVNFELDVYTLSERLIMQILFTKAYIGDETEIFKSYVAGGPNTNVEAAFLTYRSVEYMRDDRLISPYIILDIGRVHKRGYQLPLVTNLAYLRYFAENKWEREDADEEVIREFLLATVIEKELMLPFIQEYLQVPGMESLADKTFLSYKTTPKSRVMIHYLKNGEEEGQGYHKEEMKEVYFGVYVKDFVLFYGEQLQYYITEEQENKEQLTESGILQCGEGKESNQESRYQMINEMAIAQNLGDYSSTKQMLEEYWKTEFVVEKVFHL